MSEGEFVALMGPSGCGKSTLLNLVAGLDTADEGDISVAGEQVTGRSEDDLARLRRRHIGLVFQFFNLLEGMTVLENVALPAVIAGRRRKMAETRAADLLTGAVEMTSSLTFPAASTCRMTSAPPPTATSPSPAASAA